MSRRLGILLTALVVALAGLALLPRGGAGLTGMPLRDFVEYWAAGRLLADGENPYDPARIHELERQAGRTEDPILMWNPPWALPFVLPFGALPVRTAHLLWLAVQLLALLASAELLWRHYGGDKTRPWLPFVVTLTFVPALSALIVGQISPLMLLGAAAFLPLIRARRDFAAGAVTALLAVKPHMAYLFWVALVVWAIGARRWRVLLGGALAGAWLTAAAIAFRPTVLADYWQTLRVTPSQYASPTLGYLLRLALDAPGFGWQFVPLAPALAWLAWWGQRNRGAWDWSEQLPPLLLASALTAAYGAWLFDLVILLVPIVAVAAPLSREGSGAARGLALGVHAAITAGGLSLMLIPSEVQYLHYLWITPAVTLGYLTVRTVQEPPAAAERKLLSA
jgi:hypothetical protein